MMEWLINDELEIMWLSPGGSKKTIENLSQDTQFSG
jgi:hypothetical protein